MKKGPSPQHFPKMSTSCTCLAINLTTMIGNRIIGSFKYHFERNQNYWPIAYYEIEIHWVSSLELLMFDQDESHKFESRVLVDSQGVHRLRWDLSSN